MQAWPAVVFGWPSAFGGAILLIAGIVLRNVWVAALGALLSAGFCVYIGMNPFPFRLMGPIAFASSVLSVVAVQRRATLSACAFLLPFLAISGYLAYAIRMS